MREVDRGLVNGQESRRQREKESRGPKEGEAVGAIRSCYEPGYLSYRGDSQWTHQDTDSLFLGKGLAIKSL